MRIVSCDDNRKLLDQVKKYVIEFFSTVGGMQPEYACYTSGEELLQNEDRIDIAFLDVEMPGMSGIHVGSNTEDGFHRFCRRGRLYAGEDHQHRLHSFRHRAAPYFRELLAWR